MRVLTVGNLYPPHHLGGYELVWRDGVAHLREVGWDVRVLATTHREPDAHGDTERLDREGDVHRELEWYWRDHEWPRLPIRQRVQLERRNAEVLSRHLDDFRPDAVGWWSMGGMSLSLIERVRRLGIPAAGFVCEEWMLYGPTVDAWMRFTSRRLVGPLAQRATGIPTRVHFAEVGPWLFPSEMLRRDAVVAHGLTDTAVAHQGIDRDLFPEMPRPSWGWRLLYVGRIDPRKGIDLTIEALRELPPEATLTVIGAGDDQHLAELRSLAESLGLAERVGFLPPRERGELAAAYAEADAIVFPVRWREPWGLVPLEAMSVGTPVIATGRGGSGEYLRDGENSLLFDPDSGAGALAAAVRRLADDSQLRQRLMDGGRQTTDSIPADGFNIAVRRTLERAVTRRDTAR